MKQFQELPSIRCKCLLPPTKSWKQTGHTNVSAFQCIIYTGRQFKLPYFAPMDQEHTPFVSEQEGQENPKLHKAHCKSMGRISVWEAHDISCRRTFTIDLNITPCQLHFPANSSLTCERGEPVTGYGGKQQLPTVVQFKKDTVHIRDTILNLVIQ